MRRFTIALVIALSPAAAAPAAALDQDGWRWTAPQAEEPAAKSPPAAKPAAHPQPAAARARAMHGEPAKPVPGATPRPRAHGPTASRQRAGRDPRHGWVSLEWPHSVTAMPWQRLDWPDWPTGEVQPGKGTPED
jgi:hypothetical protein